MKTEILARPCSSGHLAGDGRSRFRGDTYRPCSSPLGAEGATADDGGAGRLGSVGRPMEAAIIGAILTILTALVACSASPGSGPEHC